MKIKKNKFFWIALLISIIIHVVILSVIFYKKVNFNKTRYQNSIVTRFVVVENKSPNIKVKRASNSFSKKPSTIKRKTIRVKANKNRVRKIKSNKKYNKSVNSKVYVGKTKVKNTKKLIKTTKKKLYVKKIIKKINKKNVKTKNVKTNEKVINSKLNNILNYNLNSNLANAKSTKINSKHLEIKKQEIISVNSSEKNMKINGNNLIKIKNGKYSVEKNAINSNGSIVKINSKIQKLGSTKLGESNYKSSDVGIFSATSKTNAGKQTSNKNLNLKVVGGKGRAVWDPNNKMPKYPKIALENSMQGKITLELLVNTKGQVISINILKKSGYNILNLVTQNAANNWKITILQGNKSVSGHVVITIQFRLTN